MVMMTHCNSIKVGDGDTLSLVIKHMFVYFKELGATKYSIACFEFVAQQQIIPKGKNENFHTTGAIREQLWPQVHKHSNRFRC